MNFCSHCGSDRLEWQVPAGDNRHRYICQHCDTIHYENPKVVVGCLALWEGKILLCRRDIEPRKGLWNLPAGFLELEETVEAGARRELREEALAEIDVWHQHTLYTIPHVGQVYIHFIGELINGKHAPGVETTESVLFAPEDIPWDEIAFTSTTFAIKKYLEHQTTPSEPMVHQGIFQKA